MPLLAYCIAEDGIRFALPDSGVLDGQLTTISEGALQCFVSEYDAGRPAASVTLRESALAFNRILQALLQQGTIIPFRFPTILKDREEVKQFLGNHQNQYLANLQRLRGKVQMEFSLTLNSAQNANAAKSGREYLESRRYTYDLLEAEFASVRRTCALAQDWRQRDVPGCSRLFALVDYSARESLLDQVKALNPRDGILIRISGPWPPTEFLKNVDGSK